MLNGSDLEQILRGQSPRWVDLAASLRPILRHIDRLDGVRGGQSAAVAFTLPKTSALVFDRVWGALDSSMPPEIAFWTGTIEEAAYVAAFGNAVLRQQPDTAWGRDAVFGGVVVDPSSETLQNAPYHTNKLAAAIGEGAKGPIIPVYSAASVRDREFSVGSRAALVASIDGLNLISEDDLSWEQVREIRRDRDSVRKLRRLMHWLERDMIGRDLTFIQDELAIRIEDYHAVLANHGLRTVIGSIASTLDSKALLGCTAAVAALSYAQESSWAAYCRCRSSRRASCGEPSGTIA